MVRTFAWRLGPSAIAVVGLASCAGAPPPNPAYGPGFAAASARPVRLELAGYNPDGRCSSPFPLTQLRAKLFTGDGNAYQTPVFTSGVADTSGFGPLNPSELSGSLTFGQLSSELFYFPPVDLLPLIGGNLVVTASVNRQPNVRAQLVIPPRFDCPQFVNLSGRPGAMGSASDHGGFGEPGPTVRVSLGYVTGPGQRVLILVRIDDARGLRARTVFAPDGPALQILLDGGVGGSGGVEIRHGYGANLFEIPGGIGGVGGDGGAAEILYDDTAPELERKVLIVNRGGPGGTGGGGAGSPGRPGPLPRSEPAPVRQLFRDELAHGVPVRIHGAIEPAANQSI
jgi:hypothetical protein